MTRGKDARESARYRPRRSHAPTDVHADTRTGRPRAEVDRAAHQILQQPPTIVIIQGNMRVDHLCVARTIGVKEMRIALHSQPSRCIVKPRRSN